MYIKVKVYSNTIFILHAEHRENPPKTNARIAVFWSSRLPPKNGNKDQKVACVPNWYQQKWQLIPQKLAITQLQRRKNKKSFGLKNGDAKQINYYYYFLKYIF